MYFSIRDRQQKQVTETDNRKKEQRQTAETGNRDRQQKQVATRVDKRGRHQAAWDAQQRFTLQYIWDSALHSHDFMVHTVVEI